MFAWVIMNKFDDAQWQQTHMIETQWNGMIWNCIQHQSTRLKVKWQIVWKKHLLTLNTWICSKRTCCFNTRNNGHCTQSNAYQWFCCPDWSTDKFEIWHTCNCNASTKYSCAANELAASEHSWPHICMQSWTIISSDEFQDDSKDHSWYLVDMVRTARPDEGIDIGLLADPSIQHRVGQSDILVICTDCRSHHPRSGPCSPCHVGIRTRRLPSTEVEYCRTASV